MKTTYHITVAAASLLMLAGCSDSDKWTPGPVDTDKGVSAYFQNPSGNSYIFSSDQSDMSIPVKVSRQLTDGEATVGIALTSEAEGFTAPSSVTFAAGESETTFEIDCSGIPSGTAHSVTLTLSEDQTDIYGIGLTSITLSAIKADWVLISDDVRYLYSDYSQNPIYPATYAEMYQLEGTHMFKLTDFFGSDLDMTFECDTPGNTTLYPLKNADFENVTEDDRADLAWYLYDEANVEWPSWVPGNVTGYPAISYLMFYSSPDYNSCNMIYYEDTLYGYIGLTTGVTMDDGNFEWGSFQVDFTLKYNPF